MKRKNVYLIFSVYLLIPFILMVMFNYSSKVEAYPAILMPGGAGKLDLTKEEIEFSSHTVWALDKDGNLTNITNSEVFSEIPSHFMPKLIEYNFGLEIEDFAVNPTISHRVNANTGSVKVRIKSIFKKYIALRKIKNSGTARDWLKKRLEQNNFQKDSIILRQMRISVEPKTRQKTAAKVINERTIKL